MVCVCLCVGLLPRGIRLLAVFDHVLDVREPRVELVQARVRLKNKKGRGGRQKKNGDGDKDGANESAKKGFSDLAAFCGL